MKVFLDDERNHHDDGWTHVRTVAALFRLLDAHGGEVTDISFDNDLQILRGDPTVAVEGWEAVRDIVERRLDDPGFLQSIERFVIHSANVEAVATMHSKLRAAIRAGVFEAELEHAPSYGGRYPLDTEDPRTVDVFG